MADRLAGLDIESLASKAARCHSAGFRGFSITATGPMSHLMKQSSIGGQRYHTSCKITRLAVRSWDPRELRAMPVARSREQQSL